MASNSASLKMATMCMLALFAGQLLLMAAPAAAAVAAPVCVPSNCPICVLGSCGFCVPGLSHSRCVYCVKLCFCDCNLDTYKCNGICFNKCMETPLP